MSPRVKLENLPWLSEVVRFGLGSRESAERDRARAEARGEKLVRVKGTKFRPLADEPGTERGE